MDDALESEFHTQSSGRVKWILLLVAVLLSALTFVAMRYVDRFGVETEQLLKDAEFLEGDTNWEEDGIGSTSFPDNQLKITNRPGISPVCFKM